MQRAVYPRRSDMLMFGSTKAHIQFCFSFGVRGSRDQGWKSQRGIELIGCERVKSMESLTRIGILTTRPATIVLSQEGEGSGVSMRSHK